METSDKTQAFEDSIEESGGEVRALCIKTKLSLITVSCSGDKMCEGSNDLMLTFAVQYEILMQRKALQTIGLMVVFL